MKHYAHHPEEEKFKVYHEERKKQIEERRRVMCIKLNYNVAAKPKKKEDVLFKHEKYGKVPSYIERIKEQREEEKRKLEEAKPKK